MSELQDVIKAARVRVSEIQEENRRIREEAVRLHLEQREKEDLALVKKYCGDIAARIKDHAERGITCFKIRDLPYSDFSPMPGNRELAHIRDNSDTARIRQWLTKQGLNVTARYHRSLEVSFA